jgi:hypothetical protein
MRGNEGDMMVTMVVTVSSTCRAYHGNGFHHNNQLRMLDVPGGTKRLSQGNTLTTVTAMEADSGRTKSMVRLVRGSIETAGLTDDDSYKTYRSAQGYHGHCNYLTTGTGENTETSDYDDDDDDDDESHENRHASRAIGTNYKTLRNPYPSQSAVSALELEVPPTQHGFARVGGG